jgi:hypothetical protein
MSDTMLIYLWSISGGIRLALTIIGLVFGFIGTIMALEADDNCESKAKYLFWFIPLLGLMMFILTIFIPNKQDLALLLLYPRIKQEVINTNLIPKTTEASELYLDKVIKELKQDGGH